VRWKRLLRRPTPVRLDMPNVPKEQSNRFQATLDRSMAACGCQEGTVGLIVAGLLVAAYFWRFSRSAHVFGWSEAGLVFGVLISAALAGKAFGLLRSWIRLRRSVQEFKKLLQI
jgi:hypothetical protein